MDEKEEFEEDENMMCEEDEQIGEGEEDQEGGEGGEERENLEQAEDMDIGEVENTRTSKLFRTQYDFLKKTDQELFEDKNVPDFVKKTYKYRARKKIWNEMKASAYVEGKTSLELFQNLNTTSQTIKETKLFKKRISELTTKEKSKSLIANSVDQVVESLKKTPTPKNKDLVKVIAAAVSSNK